MATTVGQILEQARQRFPSDPDAKELWVDEQLQRNVIEDACVHIGNALEERKSKKQVFDVPIDRPKDHFARTSGNLLPGGLKMCKQSAAKYDFSLTSPPRAAPPKIDPMTAISMAATALAKSMTPPLLLDNKRGDETEPPSPQRDVVASPVMDTETPKEPEQDDAMVEDDHVIEAPPHQRRNTSPLLVLPDDKVASVLVDDELNLDNDDDTKANVAIIDKSAVAVDESMAIDKDSLVVVDVVDQSSGTLEKKKKKKHKHRHSKKQDNNNTNASEEDEEFVPGDDNGSDAYEYASHDNSSDDSSASGNDDDEDEEKDASSLPLLVKPEAIPVPSVVVVEEEIEGDVEIPDLQQRARQLFRPLGPNDDESITDGESSRCGFEDDDNYTDVVIVAVPEPETLQDKEQQQPIKKRTIHQTAEEPVVVSSPKQQAANSGVHPLILEQVENCAKEYLQQQQRSSSYATFSKDELKEAFRLEIDRIVNRSQSKIEQIFQKLRPLVTETTVDLSKEERRSLELYCRYIDGFLINCQMRLSGPNILSSMAERLYAADEHPRLRFIMEQLRSCYRSSARCLSDDPTKFSAMKKESSSAECLKCFLTYTDWTPQQQFHVIRLGADNCTLSMIARSTFFVLLLDFAFHTRDSLIKHIVASLKQKTGLSTLAEAAAAIGQNYETIDDFVDSLDKQYSEWFIGMWTRAHSRLSVAIQRANRTAARLATGDDDDDD